ncbi:MAG: Gfo/Idh/MocA family oxidoreductase, partial [Abditibacteriales bacterium]|nr:Gfo/Idh/MocA family oxidoreductase [Abditibacteriales bacterium]MDW8367605.1 Gfo/Idh/MocA family oxidoreductase [Abditibacteriales bacterium]
DPRGARIYADHEAMLDQEPLDALFVTVPPFAHTNQEILAAQRGIALFVAKPVALTLEKARAVEAAIAASGVINQVGYMWRYADITEKAKEIVGDRPVGMVLGHVLTSLPGTAWWRVRAQSGGQIVEQSTHIFDLARYFAGEVTQVFAWGRRQLIPPADAPTLDFEDVTTVNLQFANGAVGNVSSTCALRGGRYSLEIIGRYLHLNLNYVSGTLTGTVDAHSLDVKMERSGYFEQVASFLQAVRQRDQSLVRSSYADAARTLAVTLAADASLRSGQVETVVRW